METLNKVIKFNEVVSFLWFMMYIIIVKGANSDIAYVCDIARSYHMENHVISRIVTLGRYTTIIIMDNNNNNQNQK